MIKVLQEAGNMSRVRHICMFETDAEHHQSSGFSL